MINMARLTCFDGEFWVHKNFPPVAEDTIDAFVDCVKELAERLAAIEDILGDDYDLARLHKLVQADKEGWCVAHGRWYDVGSLSCRCSNCGGKNNRESNYCPNCGARMYKERGNEQSGN